MMASGPTERVENLTGGRPHGAAPTKGQETLYAGARCAPLRDGGERTAVQQHTPWGMSGSQAAEKICFFLRRRPESGTITMTVTVPFAVPITVPVPITITLT